LIYKIVRDLPRNTRRIGDVIANEYTAIGSGENAKTTLDAKASHVLVHTDGEWLSALHAARWRVARSRTRGTTIGVHFTSDFLNKSRLDDGGLWLDDVRSFCDWFRRRASTRQPRSATR